MNFRYFVIISRLKRAWLHLNKLESRSPKDALYQVNLNWPDGSGEADFKNLSIYFRYFVIIFPGALNKLEFPLPKVALYQSLVEIGPVVLEKKRKMWKVYEQIDGRTTDQKSSLELLAQVR